MPNAILCLHVATIVKEGLFSSNKTSKDKAYKRDMSAEEGAS